MCEITIQSYIECDHMIVRIDECVSVQLGGRCTSPQGTQVRGVIEQNSEGDEVVFIFRVDERAPVDE